MKSFQLACSHWEHYSHQLEHLCQCNFGGENLLCKLPAFHTSWVSSSLFDNAKRPWSSRTICRLVNAGGGRVLYHGHHSLVLLSTLPNRPGIWIVLSNWPSIRHGDVPARDKGDHWKHNLHLQHQRNIVGKPLWRLP